MHFFHHRFRAFGLFASDGAESHEDGEVDGPGIIKNASNDTLDLFDVFWQKRGGVCPVRLGVEQLRHTVLVAGRMGNVAVKWGMHVCIIVAA